MSTDWVPPRPGYHLRVFAIGLLLIVLGLVGFLFLVSMESVVQATGVVKARDEQDVRARLPGVIEPGWYEGEVTAAAGPPLRVRVDVRGDGTTDPSSGKPLTIRNYKADDGRVVDAAALRFHKLEHGDELWPGQVLARVHADELELRLKRLDGKLRDQEARGQAVQGLRAERDEVERQLGMAVLQVPQKYALWIVLKRLVEPGAAVKPGDAVALLAPLDPTTRQPLDPLVYLEVSDRHRAEVAPGQAVRLYLTMYNHRLHGHAEGTIERVDPLGEAAGGVRRFRAVAAVTSTPFPLRSGASCKAEIVAGRKRVYRIILEQ